MRRTSLVLLTTLALFALPHERAAAIDGVVFNPTTGHYYKRYTNLVSWTAARDAATAVGGYLAVITTSAENDWVLANVSAGSGSWLGATDSASDGTWVWVTGEAWSYTNWNAGEPNGGQKENYLEYQVNQTGWNDEQLNDTQGANGYIVEWDVNPNSAPDAPTGLSATALTDQRVDLAWTDATQNETAYEVERAASGEAFGKIATLAADATAYSDNGASGETEYSYRVRATNDIGPSGYSNTVVLTTPPIAPADIDTSALSNTSVRVTWLDQSAVETEFQVERALGCPGLAWTPLDTVAADATEFVDGTVSPELEYSYRVRAAGAEGTSEYGAESCITLPPADPTAQPSTVLDGNVRVKWLDTSNVETSFEVQRGIGCPGQGFSQLATVPADSTEYLDTTALPEAEYAYRVRGVGPEGPSGWTDEICVAMPPFAPSGVVAEPLSASRVRVTWNDNTTREGGYTLMRTLASDISFRALADVGPNVTEYTDVTARQETAYLYRVAAYDENGRSKWGTADETGTPAILIVKAVTVRRPRGKRPAKLTLIGEFDIGETALVAEDGGTLTVGDGEIVIPEFVERKKVLRYRAPGVRLDLRRSRVGSSRVTFVLKADGDIANDIAANGALACGFTQGSLNAGGSVEVAKDKYRPGGRFGRLVDPAIYLTVVSAGLRLGASDTLRFKASFDASGGVPDEAPDVIVRLGFYEFTAKGDQFTPKKKRWLFAQRGIGARKVTLDYGRGVATMVLSKVELGNYDPGAESVRVALEVGASAIEDFLVLAVRKTSMRY